LDKKELQDQARQTLETISARHHANNGPLKVHIDRAKILSAIAIYSTDPDSAAALVDDAITFESKKMTGKALAQALEAVDGVAVKVVMVVLQELCALNLNMRIAELQTAPDIESA